MREVRKVTDSIGVAYDGGKVHLEVHRHLDAEFEVFFTQAALLPPDVARQLGEALIEMAAQAPVPAVAS